MFKNILQLFSIKIRLVQPLMPNTCSKDSQESRKHEWKVEYLWFISYIVYITLYWWPFFCGQICISFSSPPSFHCMYVCLSDFFSLSSFLFLYLSYPLYFTYIQTQLYSNDTHICVRLSLCNLFMPVEKGTHLFWFASACRSEPFDEAHARQSPQSYTGLGSSAEKQLLAATCPPTSPPCVLTPATSVVIKLCKLQDKLGRRLAVPWANRTSLNVIQLNNVLCPFVRRKVG